MEILENVRLALGSVLANKLRALLTMLGIIIGIGSVIAIVTVGDSMAGSMNAEMSGFGGRNVTIGVQQKSNAIPASESSPDGMDAYYYYQEPAAPAAEDLLLPEMVADYQRVFKDEIEAISLSESLGAATLNRGRIKANVDIYGVNPGYMTVEKMELRAGRLFREKDMQDARYLALVSDQFVKKYWAGAKSDEEAVGESLVVETGGKVVRLYIAGVYHLPDNGAYSFGGDTTRLLLPVTLAKSLAGKDAGYNSITVMPKAETQSTKFLKETNTFFASYYTRNPKMTAVASSNESFLKSMNEMMNKLKFGIGAIAAISLLVGGIGVMNIMMVSVTERTREIGVRMALGAKGHVILFQFIVEAMLLCLVGGIIGVALGVGLGSFGASLLHYPARPSITAILVAVGFSMSIGLFFGYYPASKAAKLDPIEALRYE